MQIEEPNDSLDEHHNGGLPHDEIPHAVKKAREHHILSNPSEA